MQIVSSGDNLHEMPNPVFWFSGKKIRKIPSMCRLLNYQKRIYIEQHYSEALVKYSEDGIIFDLITTNTLISTYSSSFVVFRLQPFFIKAYVVGSHLNCLNSSRQFK